MQELLKELIISVREAGLTQILYYSFHFMDFVSVFLLALWISPKIGMTRKKGLLTVLIVYPLIYVWMLIQYWIESGFRSFGGQHMVTMFIWVPIAGLLSSKLLKVDWKTTCFFLAPCVPLVQTIGHLGCIFAGCCHGYACSWGIYNVTFDEYQFPIQPIESMVALSIVIYLIIRAKKLNYVPDAYHYPIMMILFGSTRFICEFFRDNNKIFLGCSKLSYHSLFMCIVGIIAIVLINKKYNEKKSLIKQQ